MKNLGKWLLAAGVITFASCKSGVEREAAAEPVENVRTTEFDAQFGRLLNAYDTLHDKLVVWDSAAAKAAAGPVLTALNEVNFAEAHSDSIAGATITKIADGMKAELDAFRQEEGLTEMRHSFFSISESLFSLAQQTKYRARKVYQVQCPMAFNDNEEARWVSLKPEVMNPYLGTKHPTYGKGMLECGAVIDSTEAAATK